MIGYDIWNCSFKTIPYFYPHLMIIYGSNDQYAIIGFLIADSPFSKKLSGIFLNGIIVQRMYCYNGNLIGGAIVISHQFLLQALYFISTHNTCKIIYQLGWVRPCR